MLHLFLTDKINMYYTESNICRAETWVLALGGYGATMPDKLGGALVSPDEKYSITIKLIS